MRLLYDLYANLSASRLRGVGRYEYSLFCSMYETREGNEIISLGNGNYAENFEVFRKKIINRFPEIKVFPYYHPKREELPIIENDYRMICGALVNQAYHAVNPDIVMSPIFEGRNETGVLPIASEYPEAFSRISILYDLIPLIFSKKYLDPDPIYKNWYQKRLEALKNTDLLLSISESSRQDAINLLGLDGNKIVNISGGVDDRFYKYDFDKLIKENIQKKYNITRPFILYMGNDDFRKNMIESIRAFANLPEEIRSKYQFVINKIPPGINLKSLLTKIGLKTNDIILIGQIPDEDLHVLYNICELFFFPSLYEGFGLPVLEAMKCGAPVIAANNSSIPEIVERSDMLFDSSNQESMVSKLYEALTNNEFKKEISSYGEKRSKDFTWRNSSNIAWEAIGELSGNKKYYAVNESNIKKKIAYLSPFPPQKSGIADYSADLLDELKEYFDIDLFTNEENKDIDPALKNNFEVFHWMSLVECRDRYDMVIYQMGNSEFHIHMVDLLRDIPGLVVLHDFFLSNLSFIEEFYKNDKDAFIREIENSHGLVGVIDYLLSDVNSTRDKWPNNWDILKYANSLVVHSPYQKELLKKYYGNGWTPKLRVINMLRKGEPTIGDSEKIQLRKKLSLNPQAILISSFGHIAPTKLDYQIIKAFIQMMDNEAQDAILLLIGQTENGEYGRKLTELIDSSQWKERIFITGYVSAEEYADYMQCTDIAVQLRTNTRGETSKAVYDCLAYGLPTIVNQYSTFNDLPDEATKKIPEEPEVADIESALLELIKDSEERAFIGKNACEYIEQYHNPGVIAEEYAKAINLAIETSEKKLIKPIVNSLQKKRNIPVLAKTIARDAGKNFNLRCQSRLLIDVTDLSKCDYKGGIQRVVKSLSREWLLDSNKSLRIELVKLESGKLVRENSVIEQICGLEKETLNERIDIEIGPGDHILMLDASWTIYSEFKPVFEKIRAYGGKVITTVYDIIPIQNPELCHDDVLYWFESWLHTAIQESDQLICISESVAHALADYVDSLNLKIVQPPRITHFHLGSDIPTAPSSETKPFTLCEDLISSEEPVFIIVSTIEPRKGHSYVLDAFEKLWNEGYNYKFCIIGKAGWNVDALLTRIKNHPQIDRNLFYLEHVSDADLNQLYCSATGLITSSVNEGFGLPIVEAARNDLLVLASDIPVHREVGGKGAVFFSLSNNLDLVDKIKTVVSLSRQERIQIARKIETLSWKESASWVLESIGYIPENR